MERKSAAQTVYQQLKDEFYRGEYPKGRSLPSEKALAQAMGHSHLTVREALRMLENDGFITVTPGGSTTSTGDCAGGFVRGLATLLQRRQYPSKELKGVLGELEAEPGAQLFARAVRLALEGQRAGPGGEEGVRDQKVYYAVYLQIRRGIIDGVLPPQTRLPSERAMMELFERSRPSIREALSMLGQEWLITTLGGSGATVNAPEARFAVTALKGLPAQAAEKIRLPVLTGGPCADFLTGIWRETALR